MKHARPSFGQEDYATENIHLLGIYAVANYNQLHSILRFFNVLQNFPFTTSETMGDNYLRTWYKRVAWRVAK